jgi:hypothetical protein
VALVGDFDQLRRLVADARAVSRGVPTRAHRAAAAEVSQRYVSGYTQQQDPWGVPWRTTRAGKSPVLRTTGAMMGALISVTSSSVKVRPPRYWVYHQIGANNMERRAVLPFEAGSNWDRPILDAVERAVLGRLL